jgi:hypothetical protein
MGSLVGWKSHLLATVLDTPFAMYEEDLAAALQQEMEMDDVIESMVEELLSSSDEEMTWGGSRKGKQPNKNRNFTQAYQKVVEDYFNGRESVYDEKDFERRFRMPRTVFFQDP